MLFSAISRAGFFGEFAGVDCLFFNAGFKTNAFAQAQIFLPALFEFKRRADEDNSLEPALDY